MTASHDITACARLIRGDDSPAAVDWVIRRLRRGEFSGYRAARRWRMTDSDIEAAIESLRPRPVRPRPVTSLVDVAADLHAARADRPLVSSMTRTSQRRLAR